MLDREASLRLLATATLGRIGVTDGALPTILPVNFRFDGQRILVRTERRHQAPCRRGRRCGRLRGRRLRPAATTRAGALSSRGPPKRYPTPTIWSRRGSAHLPHWVAGRRPRDRHRPRHRLGPADHPRPPRDDRRPLTGRRPGRHGTRSRRGATLGPARLRRRGGSWVPTPDPRSPEEPVPETTTTTTARCWSSSASPPGAEGSQPGRVVVPSAEGAPAGRIRGESSDTAESPPPSSLPHAASSATQTVARAPRTRGQPMRTSRCSGRHRGLEQSAPAAVRRRPVAWSLSTRSLACAGPTAASSRWPTGRERYPERIGPWGKGRPGIGHMAC